HGLVPGDVEDVDGWRVHRTAMRPNWLSRGPGVLYLQGRAGAGSRGEELSETFRPDILHAPSPVLNALPALRVGRRLGIPVVYELRALGEGAAVDRRRT